MAARLDPKCDARTRDKIKTIQLTKRLEDFGFGLVELSQAQVSAILGLLRKTLPDLSAVEHTGDAIQPFAVIPQQMEDVTAWQDTFKPSQKPDVEATRQDAGKGKPH